MFKIFVQLAFFNSNPIIYVFNSIKNNNSVKADYEFRNQNTNNTNDKKNICAICDNICRSVIGNKTPNLLNLKDWVLKQYTILILI